MQYNLQNFLSKGLQVVNYWSQIAVHGHPTRKPQTEVTLTLENETNGFKWFRSDPTFFAVGTQMLPEGMADIYFVFPNSPFVFILF